LHGWTVQREIEKAKARQEELLAKNTSLRAQLGDVLAQVHTYPATRVSHEGGRLGGATERMRCV
jgi:hypothetical protein